MSAIGGIYSVEGNTIERESLDRLMAMAPSTLVPDSKGEQLIGSLALGHRGLWTTVEHETEVQPYSDSKGTCWIVSDARIDNRTELLSALNYPDAMSVGLSDPALILEAYKRWGIDCAQRLTGDFAFAIWDADRKQLMCVRDPLGVRPLFFAFDGKTFIFGSFIRQLTACASVDLSLDDDYIANFLARGDCQNERTIYRRITRLAPGHAVIVQHGNLKNVTYWQLDSNKAIQYKTDEEYEEHFREIFSNAVRARLRARGPVAADLSGGLDSSSIVCMSEEIYGENPGPRSHLLTYTDLYESPKVQEAKWVNAVVGKYGLQTLSRNASASLLLPDFNPHIHRWDEPTLKILGLPDIRGKGKILSDRGLKVLLSGVGGDQVLLASPSPTHLADLFRRLRWWALLQEAVRWQKIRSRPVLDVLFKYAVKPVLHPNTMFDLYKSNEGFLPWVNRDFQRRHDVESRMLHRRGFLPRRFKSAFKQRHYLGIMRTSAALAEAFMMNVPVEVRYPYLDQRLVEFVFAIPADQKLRPGETRSIMRRSMRGILPEMVRTRRSKGWFGETLFMKLARDRTLLRNWLKSSYAASYGYLDPTEFCRELELALTGFSRNSTSFMAALSLELWLRGNDPVGLGAATRDH